MVGRITELDPITGVALALTDLIEAVDVSDLSMAPTGTNKRTPLAELILFLQGNGITSGLIVDDVPPADTSVLWADTTEEGSSANTVRAGTAAPTTGDGNDGDFWINTTTWMIYGPKDTTWPAGVSLTGGGGGGLDQATADTLYLSKTGDDVPTADYIVRSITAWGSVGAESVFEHLGCDTIFVNESLQLYTPIYLDGTANVPTDPRHATSKGYVDGQDALRQPIDADLTTIAALAPADNTVMQRKAGAWVASTPATVKTDLAIASGDVSGLGSLATLSTITSANITDGQVANGDLATMPANTIKMNNTAGVASPTDVTVANAQTALAIPALPVTVANGGTGRNTATTAYGLIAAGTTATGVQQTVAPAASGFLKTTSTTALPAWAALTKTDVGLANVDNTADTAKPVSTAQQTALNLKADNARLINTTAPLAGGGDLSADRTLTVASATAAAQGVVELATTLEATAGTDTTRAITAAGLTAHVDARGFITSTTANSDYVNVNGDTMTGALTLAGDPGTALEAATKQYVDAKMITVSSTAPSSPTTNDLWVDTT